MEPSVSAMQIFIELMDYVSNAIQNPLTILPSKTVSAI